MTTVGTDRTAAELLASLADERQVLLKTKKRDGSWVGTPVNIAVEGDHAFFRTWSTSGKAKRLRNFPDIVLAPSTARGEPTGPEVTGHAQVVQGDAEKHARELIEGKHPVLQRLLVRAWHKVRGLRTQHYLVQGVHH